eukprot:CAMPEP_0206253230 /NCGR_PEP_ID=MMETSP0047_2-20121206/23042_1 /ASSEMBLY_ACC=CAM_ASM_000192 /TAXON_ID=195065 /ORGANISM="Chroomonas mesostigmatica_cf, Strain CCMP1168" /LENGTH=44 /DNA_ID= /DNA_START= /DNA_END= /DNA_ORIENTATION=
MGNWKEDCWVHANDAIRPAVPSAGEEDCQFSDQRSPGGARSAVA